MTEQPEQPNLQPAPEASKRGLTGGRLWTFRLMALGFASLFAFLLIETAVRMSLAARPNDIETLRRFDRRKTEGRPMTLIDFVRISDNPRLIYELIPNAEGIFREVPVRFNSAGFRDRERVIEKAVGNFRIAAIGDSVVFGWGAAAEVRFTDVLERFLNDTATTNVRYEVLNFGIPGYNSVLEVELLKERALPYSPDTLVLCYVGDNDGALPNFVSKPRDLWTARKSYALELLVSRMRSSQGNELEPGVQGADPDRIPEEYQYLVGMDKARTAIADFATIAASRKTPAYLLLDYWNVEPWRTDADSGTTTDSAASMAALAADKGFSIVNPKDAMISWLDARQWHSFALCADPEEHDAHPNAIRHAIYARELYHRMVADGALPDSADRRARAAELDRRWETILSDAETTATIAPEWKTRGGVTAQ